jgi:quinol monooxygenase YgiN
MFMRLLQLKIDPQKTELLRHFYDGIVIPEVQKMTGCLYAALIQSNREASDFTSLTLWNSKESADAYQKSGVYQKLLQRAQPFLAESAEWKIRLSESSELEYTTGYEQPVLKDYEVIAQTKSPEGSPGEAPRTYLRLFSVILQEGKLEECRRIYDEVIIPELENTKGCLFAYLLDNFQDENEVISLTIWVSKEDADEYENSGKFDRLVDNVKHTFSRLYQWKVALEKNLPGKITTSQDVTLGKYDFVTGRRFK